LFIEREIEKEMRRDIKKEKSDLLIFLNLFLVSQSSNSTLLEN